MATFKQNPYYSLVGKPFQYRTWKGKVCTGTLRELSVDQYTNRTLAVFERHDHFRRSRKADRVPIESIYKTPELTAIKSSISRGHNPTTTATAATGVSSNSDQHSNQHGHFIISKAEHPQFKPGDEVVWILPQEKRDADKPLVGKIEMTGHSSGQFVSIVQFDEPTQQLPRYLDVHPKNRNVVSIDKLIHLSTWVESMASTSPEEPETPAEPETHTDSSGPLLIEHSSAESNQEKPLAGLSWASEGNDLLNFASSPSPNQLSVFHAGMRAPPNSPMNYSELLKTGYTPRQTEALTPTPPPASKPSVQSILSLYGASPTPGPALTHNQPFHPTNPFLYSQTYAYAPPRPPPIMVQPPPNNAFQSIVNSQQINNGWRPTLLNQTISIPAQPTIVKSAEIESSAKKSLTENGVSKVDGINATDFLIQLQNSPGKAYGIQSGGDSSYMDAPIFALIAFTDVLDRVISRRNREYDTSAAASTRNILQNYVVRPWRQNYLVPPENMKRLRGAIGKSPNLELDAEEFLMALFQALDLPYFFEFDLGNGDHIHQIALPMTWDGSQRVPHLQLNSLLRDSFHASLVRLAKTPEEIFIIKLPTSEDGLIPCESVIPNLTLTLGNLLTNISTSAGISGASAVKFHLSAVILQRRQRFVALARTGLDETSPWIFMDSKPSTSQPDVAILKNISGAILQAERDVNRSAKVKECTVPNGYDLFRDLFICIYTKKL